MRRQGHVEHAGEKQPALSASPANRSEYLVKAQDSVGIAAMFGEFLVDCRAVRVTHGISEGTADRLSQINSTKRNLSSEEV